MPEVLRQIDDGHSAAAELAVDAIVLRECCLQTTQHSGRGVLGS
jgi:hypothetical protein